MTKVLRLEQKEDYFNMGYLIFYALGIITMYMLTQKPIEIVIHRKEENVIDPKLATDMEELEDKMLKEDPKKDDLYAKLDRTRQDVNDIMGGSAR